MLRWFIKTFLSVILTISLFGQANPGGGVDIPASAGTTITPQTCTGGQAITAAAANGVFTCSAVGGSGPSIGTFAVISASSPANGTIGILTDSYYDIAVRSSGAWRYFTDGREMFPITLASYTAVNVGATTNSSTHGSVTLFSNGANAGLTAYMKATPAATFTLIGQAAMTQYTTFGNSGACPAITVSDGTKYEVMNINVNGSIYVSRWTTSGSFSADVFNTDAASTAYLNNAHNAFFRVTQDATNLTYYLSADGQNWFQVYQEAKGAFLTTQASTAGFGIDTRGTKNTTCTFITSEAN